MKTHDREVMKALDTAAVVYQVVLTKCDKLKQRALDDRIEEVLGEPQVR